MELDDLLNGEKRYKSFFGRCIDAIPALIADGRIPMSTRQIADRMIKAIASGDNQLYEGWTEEVTFGTSDAIAYWKDELKIITDCELLVNINSDAKIKNGALVLTEEQYRNLKGKIIKRSDLLHVNNYDLKRRDAKCHPVLTELLGDKIVPFIRTMYDRSQSDGWDGPEMAMVCIPENEDFPALRAFSISYQPDDYGAVRFDGSENLDDHTGYIGMRKKNWDK